MEYDRYWKQMGQAYGWFPEEDDDYYYNNYPLHLVGNVKCSKCNRNFTEDDVFSVKTRDGGRKNYCIDCMSANINWCDKCGEPFETKNVNEIYCLDCCPKEKKDKRIM
jgi:hypothetical protein